MLHTGYRANRILNSTESKQLMIKYVVHIQKNEIKCICVLAVTLFPLFSSTFKHVQAVIIKAMGH